MQQSRFRFAAAIGRRARSALTLVAQAEHPVRGILVGGLLYAVAILSRYALGLDGFAFLTFFPVIAIAALVGGAAVGAGFAVLSGVTAWYLFIPPPFSFTLPGAPEAVALAGFALVAAFEVVLIDQLSAALREADAARRMATGALDAQRTLFLEFQHRVANGIQSAASLLALERRRLEAAPGGDAGAVLEAAAQRLQAMARLHRRLYDPDSAAEDFRDVVEEICREMQTAFGAEAVTFRIDVPRHLPLGVDRILSLGLLVTEAVTNALKHGVADARDGLVEVRIARRGATYELVVRDNGPGIAPRPQQPQGRESLGELVMRSLARRIDGRLEMVNDGGAVLRLTFPAGRPPRDAAPA